jgi:hypothetical protein
MAGRVERESGLKLTREQLAWWQCTKEEYTAKNKLEDFFQEFPSCIEESFQTGFRSVFNVDLRTEIRNTVGDPLVVFDVDAEKKKLSNVPLEKYRSDDSDSKTR